MPQIVPAGKQMKVLHVYKDFYPVLGGVENHLMLLTRELSRLPDMEVEVLVTNTTARTVVEQFDRVRVTKAGRVATLASTPISPALFREIGQRDCDILHLHFPYPLGEIASLLRGKARRIVITYHSDIVRQKLILRLYHPLLMQILSRADAIIAGSPNYVESSPYLSRFTEKCTVIPYGIDASLFQPSSGPAEALGIPEKYLAPFIIFVGKFRYYKGLHHLVRAMKQVEKGSLLLVGEGPEEPALRSLVDSLGLENRVAFMGHVEERLLPGFYQAGQVFVLPSCLRAEAFGVVQLEAMACGLPVVSTELGTGTSFVNRHGETGFVVPPSNPAALANAINTLLTDQPRREAMSIAARARVCSQFTKERMVKSILELYKLTL
ncbi:MAG: glycosyltransferase [Dehalococcoidia bacterium]|nr:glycosyltransferase [Dehalococcoidia bacterium]